MLELSRNPFTGLAQCNIELNKESILRSGGAAFAHELDWTVANQSLVHQSYDIILAADVVWLEHLVQPLLALLESLFLESPSAYFLLAHESRSRLTDEIFFSEAAKFTSVATLDIMQKEWSKPKVKLYKFVLN